MNFNCDFQLSFEMASEMFILTLPLVSTGIALRLRNWHLWFFAPLFLTKLCLEIFWPGSWLELSLNLTFCSCILHICFLSWVEIYFYFALVWEIQISIVLCLVTAYLLKLASSEPLKAESRKLRTYCSASSACIRRRICSLSMNWTCKCQYLRLISFEFWSEIRIDRHLF